MTRDAYIHAHRPGRADDAPLFFVFHGTGGDERQFFELAEQLAPGSEVIAPRGDVSEHGAARFFRRRAEGVYDMEDLSRAVAKLTGFVNAWRADGPNRRVMGLGYSNGANILAAAMLAAPELFDDAVLFHPLIPWAPEPQSGLAGRRILLTSGARDPICPPEATAALTTYFKAQGASVEALQHPGGHELRQEELQAAASFLRSTTLRAAE